MIGSLSGTVILKSEAFCILECGDIGYKVLMTRKDLATMGLGQWFRIFTHHVQKEDSQTLIGFLEYEQIIWFGIVNKVSGVGTKTALEILNTFEGDGLMKVVEEGDHQTFASCVSGVGKKGAEKIILGLKGSAFKVATEMSKVILIENTESISPSYQPSEPEITLKSKPEAVKKSPPKSTDPNKSKIVADAISAMSNLGFDREMCFKIAHQEYEPEIAAEGLIKKMLQKMDSV